MLTELKTEEQLKEALGKCKEFPNYLILRQCIRHALERSATMGTSRIFAHKDSSGSELQTVKEWYDPLYTITVYGIDDVVKSYIVWLSKRQPGIKVDDTPCSMFYMMLEQMERVKAPQTALPDGYSLVQLDPDIHAALIREQWKFAQADEALRTKAKLRFIPTYGIQLDATGELASFALIDDDDTYGSLHHLYTIPEHRLKRLSTVVEIECCKSCIG